MVTVLTLLCVAANAGEMPQSYLLRMAKTLVAIRTDLPAMKPVVDQATSRLANGGKLWASGAPALVAEFSGRAGGFMMIRPLGDNTPGARDVVLSFPPMFRDLGGAPEPGDRTGQGGSKRAVNVDSRNPETSAPVLPILDGPLIVTFADKCPVKAPCFKTHASETGVSPTLAMAACGWVFTGELIAALTRLGKMPVIYESIGAYGGQARIQQYKNGEIAWHEKHDVPKIEPGILGGRYVETVSAMLMRVEKGRTSTAPGRGPKRRGFGISERGKARVRPATQIHRGRGEPIGSRPPLRTVRAVFPHTALHVTLAARHSQAVARKYHKRTSPICWRWAYTLTPAGGRYMRCPELNSGQMTG